MFSAKKKKDCSSFMASRLHFVYFLKCIMGFIIYAKDGRKYLSCFKSYAKCYLMVEVDEKIDQLFFCMKNITRVHFAKDNSFTYVASKARAKIYGHTNYFECHQPLINRTNLFILSKMET